MAEIGSRPPHSVVIVSATAPFPPDTGKKVVVAGLLEYWITRVGQENVHYILVAPPDATVAGFPVPVRLIRSPSVGEQCAAVGLRTIATRRRALQESVLYARRVRRELDRILAEIDADLEIYDTVRLGQYASELAARGGKRRMVYLDDLFSRRYARMRAAMRDGNGIRLDALGEFRTFIPRPLRPIAEAPAVQHALLGLEQHLIARRERAAVQDFDTCLLVNAEEAAHLTDCTGADNVAALPPLVGAGRVAAPRRTHGSQFVFLGRMTLPHNNDAMATFLENHMSELVRQVPDAVLRIIGGGMRPELQTLASRWGDKVQIDGYVGDLDRVLSQSCAMVSPIRFGSGVKLKVLDALARGVPVVSTSIGAEGIAAGPEHGVLVEDDLDRHPRLMRQLTDRDYNAQVSRAARAHFDTVYSRAAVFRQYDEIFGF
ncbi:MAG TPA: glycosyltransferase family 4 protein [Jiangellaceae bacterium]